MNSGELDAVEEASTFDVDRWQRITDVLRATPSRRPMNWYSEPGMLRADLPEWERIYWIAIWNLRESCHAAYRRIDEALGYAPRRITVLEGDGVRIPGVRDIRITFDDDANAVARHPGQGVGRRTATPAGPARPGLFARALRRLGR
jgi:hypothetical protein